MSSQVPTVTLGVAWEPRRARRVRMCAANAATLSSMSLERVEDLRMAAEEAFIYACSLTPGGSLDIAFDVDDAQVACEFTLGCDRFAEVSSDDPAAYADVILTTVCDDFEKREGPCRLRFILKADV